MINRRTKCRPAIVHSPGMTNLNYEQTNPCWRYALKISEKANSRQPKDTEIILCNNLENSTAEYSLEKAGLKYTVLGKGINNWNNMYKVSLVLDYLKNTSANNIMYLDSTDVVIVDDLISSIEKFKEQNCRILFNSEIKFYPSCPSLKDIEDFEKKISPNEYFALNAGCWIGDKKFVVEIMKELLCLDLNEHVKENKGFLEDWRILKSDQFRWHILYHRYHKDISLDHSCFMFQNIFLHEPRDLSFNLL